MCHGYPDCFSGRRGFGETANDYMWRFAAIEMRNHTVVKFLLEVDPQWVAYRGGRTLVSAVGWNVNSRQNTAISIMLSSPCITIFRDEVVTPQSHRVPGGLISARFHNTICESLVEVAREARDEHGISRVVLSGGVFQNRYVLARSEERLAAAGFEVFAHENVPSNDGGIALGQLAVAAARERESP